jgi:hypothetical protein
MGGGTDASLRWRKIRVITDSWVMAAMMRREPRWQNGQVAIALMQKFFFLCALFQRYKKKILLPTHFDNLARGDLPCALSH